jgi:hypothetical protein
MPLKHRKLGATGHAYAATGQGYSIRAAVESSGYRFTLQAKIAYEALTDRQATHVHQLLAEALKQAMLSGAAMRHDNIPLFDLEDVAPQGKPGGINER